MPLGFLMYLAYRNFPVFLSTHRRTFLFFARMGGPLVLCGPCSLVPSWMYWATGDIAISNPMTASRRASSTLKSIEREALPVRDLILERERPWRSVACVFKVLPIFRRVKFGNFVNARLSLSADISALKIMMGHYFGITGSAGFLGEYPFFAQFAKSF